MGLLFVIMSVGKKTAEKNGGQHEKGNKINRDTMCPGTADGLAGCDDKAAQTPKYETITVEMPEQQADVAGEKIIKADRAIYSLWMLTDEHNLYRCAIPKMDSRI